MDGEMFGVTGQRIPKMIEDISGNIKDQASYKNADCRNWANYPQT